MNKILKFPPVCIIMAVMLVGIGITIGQTLLTLLRGAFSITNTGLANVLAFILVTPVTYFAYWISVHYIEKRELTELGGSDAFQEIGLGSLIGFGSFSFIIAILWLFGFYRVDGIDFVLLSFIGALIGAFVSAFAQELIFRAIIYRITEEWLGTWWALVISTTLFGLIHLSSAGATIFSALAVALQAGVILAAAYALTHRLWMALGLHMAWDFANDGIFGVGVAGNSGQSLYRLLQASLIGPKLVTGGALGIEASIITLIVMLIVGILMLRIIHQRGQFTKSRKVRPIEVT